MTLFGVHAAAGGAADTTVRQHATPREFLGRSNSINQFASMGGVTIGAASGSLLAQRLGLTAGFWVAGTVMLIIAAHAWRPLGMLRDLSPDAK
ncbi:hypothetical protein [Actinopolymorpha pittospori]